MSNRKRWMLVAAGSVALVLAVAYLAVDPIRSKPSTKVPLRTSTVHRGMVRATVTATGKIGPGAALPVNFATDGVVTEIAVKVGDQVKAGQKLAKIDDTQTTAALASASAALTTAKATLANARPAAPVVAVPSADASAQQHVSAARSSLNAAVQAAAINAIEYQNSVNRAQTQLNRDLERYVNDQARCSAATAEPGGGTSCAEVLASDQEVYVRDNEALVMANQRLASGQFTDQQFIQQSRDVLTVAQSSLGSAVAASKAEAAPTVAGVAAAQSLVIQAEANVVAAQTNQANTTLTAPSEGTVTAVNGVVGQTVSSRSSPFVMMDNASVLEVVAGVTQADAGLIQLGDPAAIGLSALPDQPVSGVVSRIDPNPAVVGNVVTYSVAVTLINPLASWRPDMIANVNVVAKVRDNVVQVPTADITTRGGTATVVLVRNGKQIPVVVTTGLVGDQSTEILSGLIEGETIVVPGPGRPNVLPSIQHRTVSLNPT